MDISSPKKSRLIYQRGDKAQGVVDLRDFAKRKKYPEKTENFFYEVKPAPRKNAPCAWEEKADEKQHFCGNGSFEGEVGGEMKLEKACIVPAKKVVRLSGARVHAALPAVSAPRFSLSKKLNRSDASFFAFRRRTSIMPQMERPGALRRKAMARFAVSSFMIPAIIFSFSFAQMQFEQKGRVLGESTEAYGNLKSAAQYAFGSDFSAMEEKFDAASFNFVQAQESINGIGSGIGEIIGALPVDTPFSTAQNLAEAGKNISLAGKETGAIAEKISGQAKDVGNEKISLAALAGLDGNLSAAAAYVKAADENMQKVDAKYVPEGMREKIEAAKQALPAISRNTQRLSEDYPYVMKMFGSQRAQKYLLLFENNTEMRATGGFIGSYGILDVEDGRIKNLAIDGIFNPDGQLTEKIIPPMPIQKISASWSMHDSNWFADFPTSARKAALFYEKTGGPTVDGVIAITPDAVKKLLEITGPIDMPAYGTVITSENFVAETQSQVEDLYNKQENKPKKILADLAPVLINKLLHDDSLNEGAMAGRFLQALQKTEESLREKHIIVYHRDSDVERMLQKRGWGGEVIQNRDGDYLSVINSNINGYKTDAMIEESINLETEIRGDGAIINTLTIRRKHNGGSQQYDWYNRVNADYMRVYVPKGSILLEASGNTKEDYVPPMDYSSFKTDPDVAAEEGTMKVDPESGTQVFEEAGKTVFGNWVYVSPQEETAVVYRYQLPFNIDSKAAVDAYSTVIQKQAGSLGSNFTASIKFPEEWRAAWSTDNFKGGTRISDKLSKDMIYAMILAR